MGKASSKHSNLHNLQRRDAKHIEESKQGNNSWKINKRNTYVPYHGQDYLNTLNKKDPAKADDEGSRDQKPVQDESLLTEEDVEDDPPYETVNPEEISTSGVLIKSELAATSQEAIRTNAEGTTPEYENYTAGSQTEWIFHDPQRQTNKSTEDGVEDGVEYRLSTAYINLKFLREQGYIPRKRKSGRPECEAAVASLRRHYRELKRRVCIQSVCDHFIKDGVLQEFDLENIMRGSYPRHARVDILLQIMLRKKSQKDFRAFNRALRKTGCEDLADKLENTDGVDPDKPYMRQWSLKEVLNAWPGIEEFLMDELQPEYILDFFMQENIFSVDEYESVFWSLGRRVEMTRTLLKKMKKNLPEALFVLLYALEEVDKDNKNMVEELEKIFAQGKEGQEAPENCLPSSPTPVSTVRLTVEKEGIGTENVEIEINKYVNNTNSACLLEIFLPPTGCEIMKSELGCVTIYLRPHSKYAFDKLSMFCKSGGLKNFVLNLMRETDIFSSLPDGELCVNIQVQYQVGELEAEDAEEIETDLIKSIKDDWSFLCEELDVQALISSSLNKALLTHEETAKLKGHAATNRHEDADYFLNCLLKKGQAGVNFLMDALKENKNMRIINRLQKSDSLYRNPKVIKENLIVHFESIVQEIDPSQFNDTFVDRNILDRKFFTDLKEKHLRRRCRAALFLREVLNKGNRAIHALLDVLTQMGYEELVSNLIESKKQEKADDLKEDKEMTASDASSPKGFTWSCCMKVNVEKKEKDETKQQTSGCSEKEEPIYMNLQWNDVDEGIGGAEEELPINLRSKDGMGQTNRPVTHPESSLSHYLESDSDKCKTYPRTRESEEAKNNLLSFITSVAAREKGDSGIDISISTSKFSTSTNNDFTF
ncbi:hypothetical protein CHS0354_037320 [Potamilus streckersoni]|uniref:CARD domain-containing protein n=1 Tax=Potamilus streckersoni TaxID=2493646 RepID=A0AAE0TJW9_9BIVA|nr:hypothetical protein CHS0354_037320 [Potamilus streckersoni]